MVGIIVFLALLQDPFDFSARPNKPPTREKLEVAPLPPPEKPVVVIEEKPKEPVIVQAVDTSKIKDLEQQVEQLKQELVAAQGKSKQLVMLNNDLLKRLDLARAANPIQIYGDAKLVPRRRRVQILVTIANECSRCHPYVDMLRAKMVKLGYGVDGDENSIIRIETITEQEWCRRNYSLPHLELWVDGKRQQPAIIEREPADLAIIYNEAVDRLKESPQLAGEPVTGLTVGKVKLKDQVNQILHGLQPFLDGGKLDITYTPRAGVIKDHLTILMNGGKLTLPVKTSMTLEMKKEGVLSVLFNAPTPQLGISMIERNLEEIIVSPLKISIRLPWMVNPELELE